MAERLPLVVFGAGGHAASVVAALEQCDRYQIVGLLEEGASGSARGILGHPVLGGLEQLTVLRARGVRHAALALGDNALRRRIAGELEGADLLLEAVVHPLACVVRDVAIGAGSFVYAFAHVGAGCRIGRGAIVSSHCSVGHGSQLEAWAHLTPGVRLGGETRIGTGAFLGMGCAVLPGVSIGADAAVGANAVVHRDVPAGAVVAGNPARTVRGGA